MRSSAALKQLRLIAAQGLPPHQSIPLMLGELERMIPCSFANFFWLDAAGNLLDSYMPIIVPAAMDAFVGQYATLVTDPREPTLDKYVATGMDIGGRAIMDTRDFTDTVVYNDVFKVLGIADGLDLVIRDASGARGIVLVNRDVRGGRWTAGEVALLRATAPHFLAALDAPVASEPSPGGGAAEASAFIVVDRNDVIELVAGDAAMLVSQFLDIPIRSGFSFATLLERLPLPLARVVERLRLIGAGRDAAPAREVRQTRWGEISVHAVPATMSGGQNDRFVVSLERRLPLRATIARNVGRMILAPRERQIACQLALGVPVEGIARSLGLSRTTVKSYLKTIYAQTNTRSREELTRLAGGS